MPIIQLKQTTDDLHKHLQLTTKCRVTVGHFAIYVGQQLLDNAPNIYMKKRQHFIEYVSCEKELVNQNGRIFQAAQMQHDQK